MLHSVAVYCLRRFDKSLLAWCSAFAMQCVLSCSHLLYCRVMQCFAVYCLRRFDEGLFLCPRCSLRRLVAWLFQFLLKATHVTHCNTLQHTTTHCNTLQHTASQQIILHSIHTHMTHEYTHAHDHIHAILLRCTIFLVCIIYIDSSACNCVSYFHIFPCFLIDDVLLRLLRF